jgi:3'(2'), 5'-bisphosphate nucleotidase
MLQEIFWAEKGQGAFKVSMPGPKKSVYNTSQRNELRALASGSLLTTRMQKVLDSLPIQSLERFGSALKMCRVAEGAADLYPRFGPTHEWDTAAGQIILDEAGCKLIDMETGRDVQYGKRDYKNNGFIASRANLDLWPTIRKLRDQG